MEELFLRNNHLMVINIDGSGKSIQFRPTFLNGNSFMIHRFPEKRKYYENKSDFHLNFVSKLFSQIMVSNVF